ncbi:MAG: alpha/beta hydrolase [Nannocystales bacterium]
MKTPKPWLIVGMAAVSLVAGVLVVRHIMQQAMYRPGTVSARADLEPPVQTSDDWEVAPGIVLRHFETGNGRVALAISGGPGAASDRSWPALDAVGGLRTHYYHQRGCGDSSAGFQLDPDASTWSRIQALERQLGLGQQIADIERVRRKEQLVLIGHSYGGLLAASYAAEFPDRVEALVLLAPADLLVMPSPYGDLFVRMREGLPNSRRAEFDRWQAEYLDLPGAFHRTEEQLMALDEVFVELYAEATGEPLPPADHPPGVWMARAQYFSLGQRHDWREFFGRIVSPTLVIHGEDDMQPEAASRAWVAAIPDAQWRLIPGADHFLHADPDQTRTAIASFLRPYLTVTE